MQFTNEELTNLLALTNRAKITGSEATAVAILQQKIVSLMKPKENDKGDEKSQ